MAAMMTLPRRVLIAEMASALLEQVEARLHASSSREDKEKKKQALAVREWAEYKIAKALEGKMRWNLGSISAKFEKHSLLSVGTSWTGGRAFVALTFSTKGGRGQNKDRDVPALVAYQALLKPPETLKLLDPYLKDL